MSSSVHQAASDTTTPATAATNIRTTKPLLWIVASTCSGETSGSGMAPCPVARSPRALLGLAARLTHAGSAQMVHHADITRDRDRPVEQRLVARQLRSRSGS